MLWHENGMAGERAWTVATDPRPRKHIRPTAQAATQKGGARHASDASVGPARSDKNGLSSEHGDILDIPSTANYADSPDTQNFLDSPQSPVKPRVLFSPYRVSSVGEDAARIHDDEDLDDSMAPGTTMEISEEGYADDTYMLALCAMMLMRMLQATGRWAKLTGQEINVGKSVTFTVQHTARATQEAQRVQLNGKALPQQH